MELSFQQLHLIANRQSFILANGEKLAVEDSSICQGGIAHIKVRFPFEVIETGEVVKGDGFYHITLEECQLATISPVNPSDTLAYIEGDGISRRELMENPFMRPDFRGTVYPARVVGYHSSNNGNSNGSKKYSKYINVSFIFDSKMITSYKASPIDEGKDKFLKLFKERIML